MSEILKKSLAQNGSDSKKTGSNSSEDVTAPEVATTSTTSDKATPSLSSGMVESPNQSDSSEMTQGSSLFRNMMIMAAMMLVVVLGASYFLMARK